MDQITRDASRASGCLSQFGLAVLVAGATLLILMVTAVLPPWAKVRSKKQQVLYWSSQVEIYEKNFAGFDFVFSAAKRRPGPAHSSGAVFVTTEYQIFWTVLFGEWAVILVAGGCVFVFLSRRLRRNHQASNAPPGLRQDDT